VVQPQTQSDTSTHQGAIHSVKVATNLDYSPDSSTINHAAPTTARIAVYEDASFAPRIIEVPFTGAQETIGALAATTHTQVTSQGGAYPYRIIMEACENLLHAQFAGVVISILDGGATVVFSDQGPGITHPAYAQNTGFTSATPEMRSIIRGVGAGFTIIREYMDSVAGSMRLDSNIAGGTVLTLTTAPTSTDRRPAGYHADEASAAVPGAHPRSGSSPGVEPDPVLGAVPSGRNPRPPKPTFSLNARQKDVLGTLLKYEFVGPQLVSESLGIGLATAYRDLETLESHGLVRRDEQKKRTLTDEGFSYIEYLSEL
jgi:hypothetical protein